MQRNAKTASKSDTCPSAQPEAPEPLRAFVRLLGREAAREALQSAGATDSDSPAETSATAKPAADTNS